MSASETADESGVGWQSGSRTARCAAAMQCTGDTDAGGVKLVVLVIWIVAVERDDNVPAGKNTRVTATHDRSGLEKVGSEGKASKQASRCW